MTFASTLSVPLTTLADFFGRAFEGYAVPLQSDPAALAARIRQEQIDLGASLLICAPNAEVAGLALIARRGDTSRLAGMGIMAPWRGKKMGWELMIHALEEARARGDRRMTLEVIEQNIPAVRLYSKNGFATVRRLVGYEAMEIEPAHAPLEEASIAEFAALAAQDGEPGLPWQLAPATLGALTLPTVAFRLDGALAILVVAPDVMTLRGLVVASSRRRQGQARRLLRGLAARFPGRRWVVPAIMPETLADAFFLSNGFRRAVTSQFEMVQELPGHC